MYAIIKTGGKQYRVEKDDIIDVELLDAELGAHVDFEDVLFVHTGNDTLIGEPSVAGYIVKGEILGDSAGPKVVSLKYMRRQHWRRKWGHRQHYTRVKILEIGASSEEPKSKAKAENEEVKEKKTAQPKAKKEEAAPKVKKEGVAKEKKSKAESKK